MHTNSEQTKISRAEAMQAEVDLYNIAAKAKTKKFNLADTLALQAQVKRAMEIKAQNNLRMVEQSKQQRKDDLTARGIKFYTKHTPIYDKSKPIYDETKPKYTEGGALLRDENGQIVYEQKVDADGNLMFEQAVDPQGNPITREEIVITSVPRREQIIAGLFAGTIPCWTDDCHALLEEYHSKLDAAAEKDGIVDANGKKKCKNCTRNAIINSIRPRMEAVLDSAPPPPKELEPKMPLPAYTPMAAGDETIDPYELPKRTVPLPGLVTAGNSTPKRKGLLRRALDAVAAALGYSPTEK